MGAGFSVSFRAGGAARESCRSGVVGVDNVYCFVDFLGRGVGGRGAAKSVELVELECRLLLVASPSKELARASYGGNVGEVKVR